MNQLKEEKSVEIKVPQEISLKRLRTIQTCSNSNLNVNANLDSNDEDINKLEFTCEMCGRVLSSKGRLNQYIRSFCPTNCQKRKVKFKRLTQRAEATI